MGAPIGLVLPWLTTPLKPMNYIHAQDTNVIEYPYSIEKLRRDNPETSFPAVMSEEELAEWGVFAIEEQDPPAFSEQTESIQLQPPALVDGVWVREWLVIKASLEEIESRTIEQAAIIRKQRNGVLTATDYSQLVDYPGSDIQKQILTQFRQALRDIPQQTGFPWNVIWPERDGGT